MNSKAVREFWQFFQAHSDELRRAGSADSPTYDQVLEELQKLDENLFFEFSVGASNAELIITAEGKQSLFPLVEAIVQAAPLVKGWKFIALKPRLGFPETATWDGYQVNLSEVVFQPLQSSTGELGLQMMIPGLKAANMDDAHNALLRALDHGLGERAFAEAIQHTEVAALDEPADEYIPLLELEKFLAWQKSKQDA
jgi:hypothetical protein